MRGKVIFRPAFFRSAVSINSHQLLIAVYHQGKYYLRSIFLAVIDMRLSHYLFVFLIIVTSQSCVYRMDIAQGNRIDADKLEQLKLGMTRKQVEFLLGKAAIEDIYHSDKAHYIYYLYEGDQQQSDQKTMILTYNQGVLVDIQGTL